MHDWSFNFVRLPVAVGIVALLSAGVAVAGVGTMESTPLWDLADHGGACDVTWRKPLEIPVSAIPNARAFTIEVKYRFDAVAEDCYCNLIDWNVSDTGFGVIANSIPGQGRSLTLKVNGEDYRCHWWFTGRPEGFEKTLTVTARDGWIVVYKDGRVCNSYMAKITPNVSPIRIGGPSLLGPTGRKGPYSMIGGCRVLSAKVWGGDERYFAPGEPKKLALGTMCGKGWQVTMPTEPLANVPNVFYFGDSISVGYTRSLRRLTARKANLYHYMGFAYSPGEEGVGARKFHEIGALADYDYVVFNNGLHSLHWTEDKVPDQAIEDSYRTLARAMKEMAPHAKKIIYLMTTPHTAKMDADGKVTAFGEKNPVVLRLNRIAKRVMVEAGVMVVDTYGMMAADFGNFKGDQYHLVDRGYEQISAAIVREIGL